MKKVDIDQWVIEILADPITKQKKEFSDFKILEGIIDARIFLQNTKGFNDWSKGQKEFEKWESNSVYYKSLVENYEKEKLKDKSIYKNFTLSGDILDVGGLSGTLREFIKKDSRYVCIDPYIQCIKEVPEPKMEAYRCLSEKLNFISAMAEFIPFKEKSFNWVHMRSMLDHVQVPDLALKEARRVLKDDGSILVGLYVEGGKKEKKSKIRFVKDTLKEVLGFLGLEKYKDHHTFHPTLSNLKKIIEDNGFAISEYFWQPGWNDQVVYIKAEKN